MKFLKLHLEKYQIWKLKNTLNLDYHLIKQAGYGIQDSFGTINIIHIEGSFTNVIGLPVAQVFEKINEIVNQN